MNKSLPINVAIACGGTGGHLFPGLAVAEQLVARGCRVTLMVSPKEVDQTAVRQAKGMEVVTLPAVGLVQGKRWAFVRGFWKSFRSASKYFRDFNPDAALAMGGFTSAPPILAAKRFGACTFLHESNTIPGRANRWLSRLVNQAFVGFPQAASRLATRTVIQTGTPVRPQFQPIDPGECRVALGLDPDRPMLLVTGGSQGASGLNELTLKTMPLLAKALPQLQYFLLTGPNDVEKVRQTASAFSHAVKVHPFFAEMNWALGAATVAVSRAGASSLAELAAMRVPSVLIPYPAATDNHQFFNASAFAETGAAHVMEQKSATPEALAAQLMEWVSQDSAREKVRDALAKWHSPNAAERIAEAMLGAVEAEHARRSKANAPGGCCSCGHEHHRHEQAKAA